MTEPTLTLNVIERDNPDGAPAVLVHGMMSSNRQWDLNVDRLGEHLRLFLVELPGHGDSPKPDRYEAYGPSEVVPAIDSIRDAAGIDAWWVIGQSLGAAVAGHHVLAAPDRARGFVMTNSRAAFGITRTAELVVPETVEERRQLPFHPINARRFPDDLKARMVQAADGIPAHSLRHVRDNAPNWSLRDRLTELQLPVLLVNGRWEKAFQRFVPVAKEQLANVEVVELEGGHSINVERAPEFDEAVLGFVGAAPAG